MTTMTASDIALEQARAVVSAAIGKAEAIGTRMNIAVVDAGGNLKAFARMDGAGLGSIDIAITKARTARFFDMPTGDGTVVGGIGVSGSTVEDDHVVSSAGTEIVS